jgi:circadian clock protein KaiB
MKSGALFRFRLYVTGEAPNSALAQANLKAFCECYISGRYDIEVVDVLEDPRRWLTDAIYLTPTLVRLSPLPEVRIVGSLAATEPLLQALGIEPPGQ